MLGCYAQSWAKRTRLYCAHRALKPFPASTPFSHAGRGRWYHAAHKIGSGRNFSVNGLGASPARIARSGAEGGLRGSNRGRGDHRALRAPPSAADVTTFPPRLLPPPPPLQPQ